MPTEEKAKFWKVTFHGQKQEKVMHMSCNDYALKQFLAYMCSKNLDSLRIEESGDGYVAQWGSGSDYMHVTAQLDT